MQSQPLRASDDIDDVLSRYSDMVYKIAFSRTKNKADADDIFQNVFLQYIRCQKSFDSEEHRKAYIIKATVNQSKSLFRSAWVRKTEPIDENTFFETKQDYELYASVLELPAKYRTVIQLYYYEDMSVSEISRALNIRESTIRTQLRRARSLLRDILKGEFDDVQ